MAEGRDRLERQIDFASLFLNRQHGRIFVDDETTWTVQARGGIWRRGRPRPRPRASPSRRALADTTDMNRVGTERRRAVVGPRPLLDTAVVRAGTERRRAVDRVPLSQLELRYSLASAVASAGVNHPSSIAWVQQKLLSLKEELSDGEEALTPELLNYIDQVGIYLTEELEKLKSTPSAQRAERERRIRTLMSMR
ncbi:protein POLYCHOME-like [Brassica napus]|uniref:protein POLYCHOME-like n=1 Tax=Brassica napus TaxID=3708 RepID=UPI0020790F3D|nr:protein POLYCHOME-like [Brassica napus]